MELSTVIKGEGEADLEKARRRGRIYNEVLVDTDNVVVDTDNVVVNEESKCLPHFLLI